MEWRTAAWRRYRRRAFHAQLGNKIALFILSSRYKLHSCVTNVQVQQEMEAETARVAAVPAEGLVVRLNSLARLLDALAVQENRIQEWWQEVRVSGMCQVYEVSCCQHFPVLACCLGQDRSKPRCSCCGTHEVLLLLRSFVAHTRRRMIVVVHLVCA